MTPIPKEEELLTPGEVAALFRVHPKTATRWATAKRIGSLKTPGGHRRFHKAEVLAMLKANYTPSMYEQKVQELDHLIAARSS